MQIRCQHCQKPFALTKEVILNALEELEQRQLHHFNAVCPHCGRTNRISQKELKRSAPRPKASTSDQSHVGKPE